MMSNILIVLSRKLRCASYVFEAVKLLTAADHPGIARGRQFIVELFGDALEYVSLYRVVASVTGPFSAPPANPVMNRRN
jgi:hypothetical protein